MAAPPLPPLSIPTLAPAHPCHPSLTPAHPSHPPALPPQNPDPKAHAYFASHIAKAYKALTDEVSRQNYQKYGHPDGPQGINLGIALPEWMFNKDKKTAPLMLLALVGCGILLPLGVMSWYMLKNDQFVGPNRIHNETLMFYLHSKFAVKESQVPGGREGGGPEAPVPLGGGGGV